MTAEIIIANGNGVALAADSAVTVGHQKIYNSAVKVFLLSKFHPVGIMIFGNAGLLSVPWEIIIKSYRKQIKDKSFNTLIEYADDFLDYINTTKDFHNDNEELYWVKSNVRGYFGMIQRDFLQECKRIIGENGKIEEREAEDLLDKIINKHYNELKKHELIEGMDFAFERVIKQKFSNHFKDSRLEIFENAKIKSSTLSKLYNIATWLHTRDIFANSTSGIVVTGYGKNEIYPSIVTYKIEGIIEGKLKQKKETNKCYSIQSGSDAIIIPFAQEEMVHTFMHGISPELDGAIQNYIQRVFARLPEVLSTEDFKNHLNDFDVFVEKFRSMSSELVDSFFSNIKVHIINKQVHPIMSMIQALPKDELAATAETLVNLTAFKRKVTNSLETVGGPIDVAVISKGDGMVWIKRKQYFPKELNSHFFDYYLKEVE